MLLSCCLCIQWRCFSTNNFTNKSPFNDRKICYLTVVESHNFNGISYLIPPYFGRRFTNVFDKRNLSFDLYIDVFVNSSVKYICTV